jgi:hypothetical protein
MFFAKADMEPVHFPIFAQPHIGLKVNGRFALLRTRRSRSHLSRHRVFRTVLVL